MAPMTYSRLVGTWQVMKCDLGSLRSVREFVRNFKEKHGERLDVLVNNGEILSSSALTKPRS